MARRGGEEDIVEPRNRAGSVVLAACLAVLVPGSGIWAAGSSVASPPAPSDAAPPPAAAPSAAPSDAALAEALAAAATDPAPYLRLLDDAVWNYLAAYAASAPESEPLPPRPPADVDRLRATLGTNQVILVLVPRGDVVWTAVVARDGVSADSLDVPRVPVMAARMAAWRDDPEQNPFDLTAALLLQEDLFRRLQTPLAGRAHVIVVAAGDLREVPFEALLLLDSVDLPPEERPYLALRFALTHEATVFSRLGWTSAESGDLVRLTADPAGGPTAGTEPFPPGGVVIAPGHGDSRAESLASLRWMRNGASGALLGGDAESVNVFHARYLRERSGGRRPDVSAVRRVRGSLLREGAPVETWATSRLWGAE